MGLPTHGVVEAGAGVTQAHGSRSFRIVTAGIGLFFTVLAIAMVVVSRFSVGALVSHVRCDRRTAMILVPRAFCRCVPRVARSQSLLIRRMQRACLLACRLLRPHLGQRDRA